MVLDNASDIMDRFKVQSKRDSLFSIVLHNDSRKWSSIRKIYATVDLSEYIPYVVDWTLIFSPIERMAWGEIRSSGLPFYPQYPVGKFFADFADPVKKIVIECDGKAFHDKQQDDLRDSLMGSLGWTVYRVSGADCNRIINDPWEEVSCLEYEDRENEIRSLVSEWATKTVDGLVWSISVIHYGVSCSSLLRSIASHVLSSRSWRFYGAY